MSRFLSVLQSCVFLPVLCFNTSAAGGGACKYEELDLTMVRIPAGEFLFGMSQEQKLAVAQESGVHIDMLFFHTDAQTHTTEEFWIDKYPVTRGQFQRFMKVTGYEIPYNGWLVAWTDLAGDLFAPEKLDWPMVGVNSVDAAAYASWLGKRLPTEIEWEKAARGAGGRLYPWGNEWNDSACYRNPGNVPLEAGFPVGSFPEGASPYGVMDMAGNVMEWVQRGRTYMLAGSSPQHAQTYTHMAASRFSWHHTMRIYNAGFRCVSDTPPENLIEEDKIIPNGKVPFELAEIREDLYLKESIRLEPTDRATFMIHVPWFPQSVWAIDCPEVTWGPFGGANNWPASAEETWKIDWVVEDEGRRIRYLRESEGKSVEFEVWVDGPAVEWKMTVTGVGNWSLEAFCHKTFSPFFSSQERVTQHKLVEGQLVSSTQMELGRNRSVGFAWALGQLEPPAAIFRSYDGSAFMMYIAEPGISAHGNGWVPCTHLAGRSQNKLDGETGGGRMAFIIGSIEDAKKHMTYP